MRKLIAFISSAVLSFAAVAGTLDVTARINDNTKQISKSLSKSITYTGSDLHFQAISVGATEVTNTIQTGIGDAGLAYILNNATGTVRVGTAAGTYFSELRAGEFAVIPLATNTADVFLIGVTGTDNNVEIFVTER